MPDNAFDPEFLAAVADRDAPPTSEEAEVSGPWEVRPWKENWGVFAAGEDRPRAVFVERETALMAAALYPADGRDLLYLLGGEAESQGFPVLAVRGEDGLKVVGWVSHFEQDLMGALHVGEYLLRSPVSLALLLEAAGVEALSRAGALLAVRVLPGEAPAAALARAWGVEVTPELRAAVEALHRQLGLEGEAPAAGDPDGEDGE